MLALSLSSLFIISTVARRYSRALRRQSASAHPFCSRFIEHCGFLDVVSSILIPPRRDFSVDRRPRSSLVFLAINCSSPPTGGYIYVTRILTISSILGEMPTSPSSSWYAKVCKAGTLVVYFIGIRCNYRFHIGLSLRNINLIFCVMCSALSSFIEFSRQLFFVFAHVP